MLSYTITVEDAGATAAAEKAGRASAGGRALMAALAREAENALKEHFLAKDAKGNGRGWPRSHFWAGAARNTQAVPGSITEDSATIKVGSAEFPVRIHALGGTVKPLPPRRALAIPRIPEAKGKRPAEFNDSIDGNLFRPKGASYLAFKSATGDRLIVAYLLASSAVIPRDPDAMPGEAAMQKRLAERARSFADSL